MGFLRRMTFPRWVIVLSLLGSVGLGYVVWQKMQQLNQVHTELKSVKGLVREVQGNAYRLNELQKVSAKEGLIGESDPELYIRGVAAKKNVSIGSVNTSVSTTTPMKGVEDRRYLIRPTDRQAKFSRGAIGNFLFKLEDDSRRVKVTDLKLTPSDRLKPGDLGSDFWTFEATMTSRQAVE